MRTIKTLAVLAVVCAVAATGFLISGIYNIGADAPHWRVTRSMIDLFREQSIAARSKGIKAPPLDDPALMAEGAEHYSAMCVQCHLAPGVSNSEMREGLYPMPPNLTEHKHTAESFDDVARDAARQFWIVKHGVKMTSMPAAGKTHDDGEIWGIVAFVRKLPGMTPEQYAELTKGTEHHEHGDAKGGAAESPAQTPEHDHHDHQNAEAAPEHQHAPEPTPPQ